jgi:GNAT superfamily N-acetyltransferase
LCSGWPSSRASRIGDSFHVIYNKPTSLNLTDIVILSIIILLSNCLGHIFDIDLLAPARPHRPTSHKMVSTNKGPRYPPPPLHPALYADVPAMVNLWLRAIAPNLLHRVISHSDALNRRNCTLFLTSMIFGTQGIVMKAVDLKDESIITGFGVWEKKNYLHQEGHAGVELAGGEKRVGKESRGAMMGGMWICSEDEKRTPLEEYIAAQQAAIERTWTKGIKRIELMALMTDPAFQGRGIGSALLKFGHVLATQENVPSFLGATPSGYQLYKNMGWNVVAEVVVDLKEWVEGARDGDMGWGVYRGRSMLRLPRVEDA